MLLIGSPMCRAFATWQYLNAVRGDPDKMKRAYVQAMVHLQFCCELYEEQVQGQRYFLFTNILIKLLHGLRRVLSVWDVWRVWGG